jgi:DNA-binding response OmpR family regulator
MNTSSRLIISNEKFISETINNNFFEGKLDSVENKGFNTLLQEDAIEYIKEAQIIDLLILDDSPLLIDSLFVENLLFKIKNIILLTSLGYDSNLSKSFNCELLLLTKPLEINKLFSSLNSLINYQGLFIPITNNCIYSEKSSLLKMPSHDVKLSDKENEMLKSILISKDHMQHRDEFAKHIWKHNDRMDTNTIETHIYNLKAKLPDGMLSFRKNFCKINI